MKYLIKHRREFAITVGAAFMAIVNFINAAKTGIISEDTVIALVYTALGVLAWYYNMPTSAENDEATTEMRQRKLENDPNYKGEKFFDEVTDDEQ